jgi:hypothetical protein
MGEMENNEGKDSRYAMRVTSVSHNASRVISVMISAIIFHSHTKYSYTIYNIYILTRVF